MFHSARILHNRTIWRTLPAYPTWKIRYVLRGTTYSHDESTSSPTELQKRIGIHKVSEENTRHDRSFALNNAAIDGWSVGWSGQRGRLCKARPPLQVRSSHGNVSGPPTQWVSLQGLHLLRHCPDRKILIVIATEGVFPFPLSMADSILCQYFGVIGCKYIGLKSLPASSVDIYVNVPPSPLSSYR